MPAATSDALWQMFWWDFFLLWLMFHFFKEAYEKILI